MKNQILKAINHINFISKKDLEITILINLQNNTASNYDYHSAEDKLNDCMLLSCHVRISE